MTPPAWHMIARGLSGIAWAALMIYVVNQVKKPTRWVGWLFAWIMNISHSSLTDWGLEHVQIQSHFTILDVGCGGGRTIEKLAAMAPNGKVFGVDHAKGSIAASRAKNAELIKAGRVGIHQASVSALPFPDDRFDLVTAVETQYYWPDMVNDMREILRELKPGGTLIVILESYKRGSYNWLQRPVMKLLKTSNLGVDGQRELFAAAEYTDIEIFEEREKGWICCVGKRPV